MKRKIRDVMDISKNWLKEAKEEIPSFVEMCRCVVKAVKDKRYQSDRDACKAEFLQLQKRSCKCQLILLSLIVVFMFGLVSNCGGRGGSPESVAKESAIENLRLAGVEDASVEVLDSLVEDEKATVEIEVSAEGQKMTEKVSLVLKDGEWVEK